MDTKTLLETQMAEQKAKLNQQKAAFQDAIHTSVADIGKDAKSIITGLAFGAGLLLAGWLVSRAFSSKPKNLSSGSGRSYMNQNLPTQTQHENPIFTMFKDAIMSFLLSIARERLMAFLAKWQDTVASNVSTPVEGVTVTNPTE